MRDYFTREEAIAKIRNAFSARQPIPAPDAVKPDDDILVEYCIDGDRRNCPPDLVTRFKTLAGGFNVWSNRTLSCLENQ